MIGQIDPLRTVEDGTASARQVLPRRGRRLALVVAVALVAVAGGWAAGGRVRSPAAAAADRNPPTPSPIAVPVERRALSDELTRRGSIRFDQASPLTLAGPVGGESSGPQVVTRAPALGDAVTEGATVLEVNGRPVFVLAGTQPMYRSLTPGASGRDVRQLEEALARLGFDPGAVDGTYDGATQAAVRRLYESKGYSAQGPTQADAASLRDAQKAAADAADRARDAAKALADAAKGPAGSELLALRNETKAAGLAVESARAAATRAGAEAAATLASRISEAEAARAGAAGAADELARARSTGQDPADPTRACGATCLARLEAEVTAKQAAATAAGAAVDLARANVASAATGAANDVTRAEDALALANRRQEEASAGRDTTAASQALEAANAAAERARADAAQLEARTGISVPAGELLFLPELPRRIDEVKAKVGEAAPGGFATVSGTTIAVDSSVEVADAGRIRKGMTVSMRLPEIGRQLEGTVDAVADKAATNGVGAGQVYVRIVPSDVRDAAQLNGAGVVVTIPLRSTNGAEVLTVPVAALTTQADGSSWVTVLDDDGTTREVQVTVGLQGPGAVEVNPAAGGRLEEGDRVVVGEREASRG